jgi:hypothetical protein
MDAALITVMQIHLSEPEGDILLFLTGNCGVSTRPCIVLTSERLLLACCSHGSDWASFLQSAHTWPQLEP